MLGLHLQSRFHRYVQPYGWLLALVLAVSAPLTASANAPQTVAKSGKAAKPAQAGKAAKFDKAAKTGAKPGMAAKSPRVAAKPKSRSAEGRGASRKASPRSRVERQAVAAPSIGRLTGLHAVDDPLDLKSGVALVVDDDSRQVLFSKNPDAVLPIASITKLMTALVVVESGEPMDQMLAIGADEAENTHNVRSRLAAGSVLSRAELLRLALMASENRAAAALARHHPGGVSAFVQAMNAKAAQLGMRDSQFVESTGLSPENKASAVDLTRLVAASSAHAIIREYSVSKESIVPVGARDKAVQFRSTNGLIGNPEWEILLQKTGYISAAGRCLVMQASFAGRRMTMVLLDSAGKYSRFGDAERLRKWLVEHVPAPGVSAAVGASLNSVSSGLPSVLPSASIVAPR